ncbi:MAG: RDD family protein [Candidatus Nanoarchaeia archaeon]
MVYASLGKRVLGTLIDFLLIILISIPYIFLFGNAKPFAVTGLPAFIFFLLIFAYYFVLEATSGKTLGKMIVKIKVVNEKGQAITGGQSFIRTFFRIIDGAFIYLVGFLCVLLSKNKQRLGDMVAKTYVIQE